MTRKVPTTNLQQKNCVSQKQKKNVCRKAGKMCVIRKNKIEKLVGRHEMLRKKKQKKVENYFTSL